MSNKIALTIAVFAILLSIHVCGCDGDDPRTTVDSMGTGLLLSAPVKIDIDDCRLTLNACLWRDFMPISPPDGQPLAASVTISAVDSGKVPAGMIPLRLWVIKSESEIWETGILPEDVRYYDGVLEFPASGGPLWDPGITVQVVAELAMDDSVYFLRASDIEIHRTD